MCQPAEVSSLSAKIFKLVREKIAPAKKIFYRHVLQQLPDQAKAFLCRACFTVVTVNLNAQLKCKTSFTFLAACPSIRYRHCSELK